MGGGRADDDTHIEDGASVGIVHAEPEEVAASQVALSGVLLNCSKRYLPINQSNNRTCYYSSSPAPLDLDICNPAGILLWQPSPRSCPVSAFRGSNVYLLKSIRIYIYIYT